MLATESIGAPGAVPITEGALLTLGGMSVESARRVTKLMMSVFRRVRDSGIGQLPRWSVEGLRDAQLQGLEMRFCRDDLVPPRFRFLPKSTRSATSAKH